MTTTWYRFKAADVLFFRDGRPFNQGDPAQMAITSLFPPHPNTAVGALRAALARGMGWDGRSPWCDRIKATLGDGEALSGLTFQGPYLTHGLAGPLFPAPAMIVREKGDDHAIRRLGPGRARDCDLGSAVRMAEPKNTRPHTRVKALTGSWLTLPGMQHVLNGGVPPRKEIYLAGDDSEPSDEENDVKNALFAREVRIGLARNPRTRTAEQGALYTAGFVRPQAGEKVALVMGVHSKQKLQDPVSPIPLGGEGRFAWVEGGEEISWPEPPAPFQEAGDKLLYTVTLIMPAQLCGPKWPGPGEQLCGLPGTIVCACHERPLMVGGWASEHFRKGDWGPQPLKAMLPPGSTWFMEADPDDEEDVRGWHLKHIGDKDKRDWGYGQILIGTWMDDHTRTIGGGDQ
ncbi:conserved hypothetical protein [Candidatus Defluviicoccus seviourii]|uniref:CRISPR-associated protein, Cmr3 family n=2 Tax=root TaxID=1 RepID=A0A564WG73_9PROT|nr:conserved hypothetical protein [uncultured Defluviicoccus sp.]VUX46998.1 conserved hypothetical protein [Candidatus Defluviicoccus seviourii]